MKGQIFSGDFALSLLVFIAASVIAFSLLRNDDLRDDHAELSTQARDAAALLAGDGYPRVWTNDTIVRAGLVTEHTWSHRKSLEIGQVPSNRLRQALRATDSIAIWVLNSSGDTIPMLGSCAIGDLGGSFVGETYIDIPSIALGPVSGGVIDTSGLERWYNETAFDELRTRDVVIIEGNLTAFTNHSAGDLILRIEEAVGSGALVAVIGDPGVPVLGINTTNVTAQRFIMQTHEGGFLGLKDNEEVNLTDPANPIPALTITLNDRITDYVPIALTDAGDVALARWIYDDAQVVYIASADAQRADTTSFTDHLATILATNATRRWWASCTPPPLPSDAAQIAHVDRAISYHDAILTLRVVTWRDA